VVFSPFAETPALRGTEDGACHGKRTGLGAAAGDRHRGAAAVPIRDAVLNSDSQPRGSRSGGRSRAGARDGSAGWATILLQAGC